MNQLSPAELAQFRQLLEVHAKQLRTTLAEQQEGQSRVAAVMRDDNALERDGRDEAALREIQLATTDQENVELNQIQAALSRIDCLTYGICSDCGAPIPRARLMAQPATQRCLSCQSEFEHEGQANQPRSI